MTGSYVTCSPARRRRNRWRATKLSLVKQVAALVSTLPFVAETPGKPSHELTSAASLQDALLSVLNRKTSRVGLFYFDWLKRGCNAVEQRNRDLLPLPAISSWPAGLDAPCSDSPSALAVCNMCIAGLNCLNLGIRDSLPKPGGSRAATSSQRAAQRHICSQVARYVERLKDECSGVFSWVGAFETLEKSSCPNYEHIRSAAVDLPAQAGTCDPCSCICPNLAAKLLDESQIFASELAATSSGQPMVNAEQRREYVRLTVRELKGQKLRLRSQVMGLGGVFAVGKPSGAQRKIWDGSLMSKWAAEPPKPRRLANPSSFLDLEIPWGSEVFFSKRDASTYFDTLAAPVALRKWFGQPPVQVHELLAEGLSLQQVLSFCDEVDAEQLGLHARLFPVHCIWPMGFSWSSAVAQDTTISMCLKAGVAEENIASLDHPSPENQTEMCFVATDDVVLVHKDAKQGLETLLHLDKAFQTHGIPKNTKKDVSLASNVTALGCDLSNNPAKVEPASGKLVQTLARTLDLLRIGHASPRAVHACLGVWQWFALMQRSFFSIFDSIYDFVQKEPADQLLKLPLAVSDELLLAVMLAPLLSARLDREPLRTMVATDASADFGFGVCACPCTKQEAANLCRLAERRGDYVRLTVDASDPVEVPRLGRPHRLRVKQSHFRTIISKRAKWQAHSGVLEAHAYLLALKWLARHPAKHHHRVPILVDAKAVVGAATKGRSSARALRTVLRSAAAYTMASDLLPRIVYIPSESNPADHPSRGRKRVRKLRK